jgi:leader peptidase (prepilin peptidase)/N-methyltransferase
MIENATALKLFLRVYMFILGAMAGSFLNVCIVRLPDRKSLIWPSSHCPKCDKPIRWFDNIPIISFIILKGKCRNCGGSISWRYPLVELLTASLFVLLILRFTNVVALAIYIVFICSLVVITFIDLQHYIIPDEISIPGIFIGLALSLIPASLTGGQLVSGSFLNSLIGCIAGGGTLYLAALFSLLVFKKEGMGGGDIKLLAMVGAFLGWKLAMMTIVVGSVLGAVVGVTLILLRLKTKNEYIPFGPYLALGTVLSLFCGERLLTLYLTFGRGLNELVLRLQWPWAS